MYKLAAIIGGVLLMAGVALAGTMTGVGSSNTPTRGTTLPATTTGADDHGREQEQRGRANEPGEDLRGPCDEAEHANDPRCIGAPVAPRVDDDDRRRDDDVRHGDNSGPGSTSSGPSDSSGHDGGDDSGHRGHGDDD